MLFFIINEFYNLCFGNILYDGPKAQETKGIIDVTFQMSVTLKEAVGLGLYIEGNKL